MSTLLNKWKELDRKDRFQIVFIAIMQIAFIGAFFIALHKQEWLTVFISAVSLILMWLPSLLERNLNVHFPLEFGFLLNLFIYSSIFLGDMQGFYTMFWWWDIVLHTGSGMALGFFGFIIMFSLYQGKRLDMNPILLAIFSACFAISLGVLWEIFEFTIDSIFGFDMQGIGLTDTMWDLIVNTVGASIVAISGYFYFRYKTRGLGVFEHYLKLLNLFKIEKSDTDTSSIF